MWELATTKVLEEKEKDTVADLEPQLERLG